MSTGRLFVLLTLGPLLLLEPGVGMMEVGSAAAAVPPDRHRAGTRSLPWKEAGLTPREAAAHLLDRLTFGASPGQVRYVAEMGVEAWLEEQLKEASPEPELGRRLANLPALSMPLETMVATYPAPVVVRRMAVQAGVVRQEDLATDGGDARDPRAREARERLLQWSSEQGWRPDRELVAQLLSQKLLRAVYADYQVREVLADFWFNHFYVGLSDPAVRQYLLAYERDAIRPHILGKFRTLLEATAKHPAMLLYLDNTNSSANPGQPTLVANLGPRGERPGEGMGPSGRGRRMGPGMGGPGGMGGGLGRGGSRGMGGRGAFGMPSEERMEQQQNQPRPERRPRGLNENYARELLELHTLGVDGGYTQQDVVEVARAFTGWTVYPLGPNPQRRGIEFALRGGRSSGLIEDRKNGFLFLPAFHDAGEKTILGKKFSKGRGIEEGLEVLDLLAAHSATARHIARKFAARFVADDPPTPLVDRLAQRFQNSGGDLRELVWALVESPEFWARELRTQKVKSPFEYAVSAVRALGGEIDNPFPLLSWVERMGQPLYRYGAPTGFPERGDFWVSAGNLMARMNFGLELATGRLPGVRFTIGELVGHREPESVRHALEVLGAQLMPERPIQASIERLLPLVLEPELPKRVAEQDPSAHSEDNPQAGGEMEAQRASRGSQPANPPQGGRRFRFDGRPFYEPARPIKTSADSATSMEVALGVLLGSPDFQRR